MIAAINYFSKWIEVESLAKITENNTKDFIWKHIVCRFGILKVIISDNSTMTSLSYSAQISLSPIIFSRVEVTNRTILRNLKARLEKSKSEWVENLPSILWAYHMTSRILMGETPYSMVYRTESALLVEIGIPNFKISNFNKENNESELRLNLDLFNEKRERAKLR